MNYILFDDCREDLLPLTFTRPVAELRVGILTMKEKWQRHLNLECSYLTIDYLQDKFPLKKGSNNIFINASVFPSIALCEAILNLEDDERLMKDGVVIAYRTPDEGSKTFEFQDDVVRVSKLWHIFSLNDLAIRNDFSLITKGRKSKELDSSNTLIGDEVFVEEGAEVSCSILNSNTGPIYIGKNAQVMEGSMVRGPFAMSDDSVLKMGAKVYGATTIGPFCKVGGEISNSVFFGYSNKGHDGFLGNSVIGEWCNLGADTNNSNLKNNYAEVRLWNYAKSSFEKSSLQFCGLIMGDHSKCGINTMFNTGTVIGVSANVFGAGFPRNFVPSFSWGGSSGYSIYLLNKVFDVAEKVMHRRNVSFDNKDKDILSNVFDLTKEHRNF